MENICFVMRMLIEPPLNKLIVREDNMLVKILQGLYYWSNRMEKGSDVVQLVDSLLPVLETLV